MKKQIIVFFGLFLAFVAPIWSQQMRLAVFEPEGKGLSNDELWMLSLVQSSIAWDINKYSAGAIEVIDRQNLEAIIAEHKRSPSAITSNEEAIKIGNLANASHILTGKITKTPKTFMLELSITDAETGKRQASYSPKSVTPSQVEDLSILKEASEDLLKQLGVSLTDEQLAELKEPVVATQVQAQTALAHGVVAQRQGTNVAALSYFYQAAAFDPSLVEAVKLSSVMSANISGINLGDNIRNDIVWRKNWVERLKETEETFYKIINFATPPYTLYYSTVIETKNINYQKETADLNISLYLLANAEWFAALQRSLKVAKAVIDGLNATDRKKDWGLNEWPRRGVSNTNPFVGYGYNSGSSKRYDIFVEFELVNQQGRVIGKNTAELKPSIKIYEDFVVRFEASESSVFTFKAVKASDISDNLTIRIASVNGIPPKTARFSITAVPTKEFPKYQAQTRQTTFTDSRDGIKYRAVEIGGLGTWMAENLNYAAEGSKCYGEDGKLYNEKTIKRDMDITLSNAEIQANCDKYGRLYNWETAMKVCPSGWHLPSDEEWEWEKLKLSNAVNYETIGKYLKAKSGWNENKGKFGNGEDTYGFAALPGGYGRYDHKGSLYFVNDGGYWWSSSYSGFNDYTAYYRYIDYRSEAIRNNGGNKDGLYSVRCLQD